MSFLLDTCVIGEFSKARPSERVLTFLLSVPQEQLHISVLTLGEMQKGIHRVTDKEKKDRLHEGYKQLREDYLAQTVAIDAPIAEVWGRLLAESERTLPAIDSLLAATALAKGYTLVTRNEKDFEGTGVAIINPWKQG